MKNLLILLVIAGALYSYFKPADPKNLLQESASSAQITAASGIKIIKTNGGPDFDVNRLAEPGQITVVEFYTTWCPTCKKLNQVYQSFVKVRPDVAIRRVQMKDKWHTAWAKKQYGLDITGTPHVLLFDQQGKLVSQDNGNNRPAYHELYQWMQDELRKT